MADTIKVPGIREPLPRWAVFAGLAVTGVGIAVYWRKRQNQAPAGTGSTDALGLGSGGLAPDTGLIDQGTYPWDGTYGNPSDPFSMDTGTGQTFGDEGLAGSTGGTGGSAGGLSGPPFSTNAQWSAYVLQQDAGAHARMAEALGLYLDGQALDATQQNLVYQAQAIAGQVPVSGSGGYPPKLRTASTQGNGGKGGTTFAVNPVSGIHAKGGAGTVEISWNKSDHATGYQVSLRNVTGHRSAGSVTTAKTSYTFRGLKAGDTFEATVLAKPAEKGARPATAQAKTMARATR